MRETMRCARPRHWTQRSGTMQGFEDHPGGKRGIRLRVNLIGRFAVSGLNGENLTPNSAKAQGLLALLLLAPEFTRTRQYLMDMLWSDRAHPQASGSLRQCLNEIRNTLSDYSDIFYSDRKIVSLIGEQIETNFKQGETGPDDASHLLEGLRVNDPAFENWLKLYRAELAREPRRRAAPLVVVQNQPSEAPFHTETLSDGIVSGLSDWCAEPVAAAIEADEKVSDLYPGASIPFRVTNRSQKSIDAVAAHVKLSGGKPRLPLWSNSTVLPMDAADLLEDETLHRLINQTIDKTLFEFVPDPEDPSAPGFGNGTLTASRLIFRNGPGDLEAARKRLSESHDIKPRGIYLAWNAYISTLLQAERATDNLEAVRDEAEALASKAIEADGQNPMLLALCSYVFSFTLGRHEAGFELANRSIGLNRSNPLAWAFRGAARLFRGDYESAYTDMKYAQSISGDGPYRYVIDTFTCVAATHSNRLEEAVRYGEIAHRLAPGYRAPLRYLAVIYAAQGDEVRLQDTLARIRLIEPDFSIEALAETAYPVPTLRKSGFLSSSGLIRNDL